MIQLAKTVSSNHPDSLIYVVGFRLFFVLCCEQREFGVASRAALVVEDGQDLTACYAIEPASVNISSCYRLWHVFSFV